MVDAFPETVDEIVVARCSVAVYLEAYSTKYYTYIYIYYI